jgi:hypothetical protein
MAASEHSSSQNLDLADWPVWRNLIGRSGSFPAAAELKTGRPEGFSASLGPSSLHRPVEW